MSLEREPKRYVLCVKNEGYAASLELRKIYISMPDRDAERRGLLRVVDESQEDYLYPADYFVPIDIPKEAAKAFQAPT